MIQKNPTTLGRDFFFFGKSLFCDFFNCAAQATDEHYLWVKKHDAGEGLGLGMKRRVRLCWLDGCVDWAGFIYFN